MQDEPILSLEPSAGQSMWIGWWGNADPVVQGVFVLLIALSVVSWGIILAKATRYFQVLREEKRAYWQLSSNSALDPENLHHDLPKSAMSRIFFDSLSSQSSQLHADRNQLDELASRFLEARRLELENGLIVLATIGNSAPFIGLLGTVWGIMHALQALSGAEMLSMEMVAGPVSEALVATAAGLFAAIPAAAAYNLFVRGLRRISGTLAMNLRLINDLFLKANSVISMRDKENS